MVDRNVRLYVHCWTVALSQHSAAAELNEIINGDGYFQDTDTFANIWYLRVRGEN